MNRRNPWWAAAICGVAGIAVFQLFGNANHGYIDTNSLFWWWIYQWMDPPSETQHGWLVLGIAVWLAARNVGKPETGNLAKPDTGNRIPDSRTVVGPDLRAGRFRPLPPATSADPVSAEQTFPVSGIRYPVSAVRLPVSGLRYPVSATVALLAALALHAIAYSAQQARLSIVALLLFTWGVLRLGGGRRWGAATAFPLAFMVFALPLNVLDSLGFWLRLWVTGASAHIAHVFHVGVIQNGTQLVAPDGRYNYDVAGACSGVRSLMALAALSLLIGYLNFQSWWRRALVLLLCFPLVYIGNVARIVSIVFAAQNGGPKWGDAAHAIMGWGVFAIVLGGVFTATALLRRLAPEHDPVGGVPSPRSCTFAERGEGTPPTFPFVIAAIVVLLATAEMLYLHRTATLPPRGEVGIALAADGRNPVELPTFIGHDWVGYPAAVTAAERDILPPDTGYSRMTYVATRDRRQVFLSLVLSGRDRTSIHRPELCLVGQGFTIAGQARHEFTYPDNGHRHFTATVLPVNHQQTTTRGQTVTHELVAYWFVNGDTVVATHWQRIALDVWNRVLHGRADRWAYVLMQTDATDGDAAAFARMQAVLDGTLPVFQRPSDTGR